jgi:dethiobiotin synthetase
MSTVPAAHFVIGTDTGIGKTLVSCALLRALNRRGVVAVGMKPVASGAWTDGAGVLRNEDADALAAVSVPGHAASLTSPYLFSAPLAPHVAARRERRGIERAVILEAFRQLSVSVEHVIVEGVGGFVVPFSDTYTSADLAADIGAPLVLVVGLRLGCINHALLTAEAARGRGLTIAGWVANCQAAGMLEQEATIATLAGRLGAPFLGVLPRFVSPSADLAAAALDITPLFPVI